MSVIQKMEAVRAPRGVEACDPAALSRPYAADAEPFKSKRILDVVGAILALAFFAPSMILICLALMCSGGRPIFSQTRVGKNGELFQCYKFRSMALNADAVLVDYLNANPAAREEWERTFKLAWDPRITPFGTFLRRTSLDELPQLFNVLKGDMSLVGPRPIVPEEIGRYAGRITAYYRCRPGITGLWQVSGRNDVTYSRRVCLDTVYARKRSIWLDCVILLRTVRAVLSGRGAY